MVGRRQRALQGRYSCIAQGASPGLIIETYLLSPKGAALPRRKVNAHVVVPLLRSSYFCVPCLPRVSYRALPSFHPGLCRSVALAGLIDDTFFYSFKKTRVRERKIKGALPKVKTSAKSVQTSAEVCRRVCANEFFR